jgi:hypothetical protein
MTFDPDPTPIHRVVQLLEQASATTGFTAAEIVAMIDCELDTNQLLDYITAVMSKRMN